MCQMLFRVIYVYEEWNRHLLCGAEGFLGGFKVSLLYKEN